MKAQFSPRDIQGVWSLVSAAAINAQGRRVADPWGPAPMGSLVLDSRGRMMAVLCDGRAEMADGEARAYSSYCGAYRLEGDILTTRVDAASEPSRIGSDQVRRLERRGDQLVLFPPTRAEGVQRELVWSRVGPAREA